MILCLEQSWSVIRSVIRLMREKKNQKEHPSFEKRLKECLLFKQAKFKAEMEERERESGKQLLELKVILARNKSV